MSDWTKQTEKLVNTWTEAQKRMWDGWFDAMQRVGGEETLEGERRKAVDAWEASVKKGLEAQAEWARLWTEAVVEAKGTPKPVVEWAKQFRGMMKSWAASQEELSHVWFELVRKMDSARMSEAWEGQGKRMMQAWQEAADRALEAQQELARLWTQAGPKS